MAERKAQNKWYPSDFDPKKHGSANGYQKSHHLRERARKLDQGILIVRFELPFNIWCEGCNNHVGMGVRYNAEKSKVGAYYSTTIYQFKMKCHLCDNHFIIKTDPQNLDYIVESGARRQDKRWNVFDNEQIVADDKDTINKLNTDSMFKLEHLAEDKKKLVKLMPTLERLQNLQENNWKNDYSSNQNLRKIFRTFKKETKQIEANDQLIISKCASDISLIEENPNDIKIAKLLKLNNLKSSSSQNLEKIINPDSIERSSFCSYMENNIKNPHLKGFAKLLIKKNVNSQCTQTSKSKINLKIKQKKKLEMDCKETSEKCKILVADYSENSN